jgi:hypothetical protein
MVRRTIEYLMKICFNWRPSIFKVLIPLFLIGGSLINLDIGSFFYQILWVPFSYFLKFWPFIDTDKPWFASSCGIIFASVIWSIIYYLFLSLRLVRRKDDKP